MKTPDLIVTLNGVPVADQAEGIRMFKEACRRKPVSVIERFEKAVRDHEMAGAHPPEDRPLIEAEYREAKAALHEATRRR